MKTIVMFIFLVTSIVVNECAPPSRFKNGNQTSILTEDYEQVFKQKNHDADSCVDPTFKINDSYTVAALQKLSGYNKKLVTQYTNGVSKKCIDSEPVFFELQKMAQFLQKLPKPALLFIIFNPVIEAYNVAKQIFETFSS